MKHFNPIKNENGSAIMMILAEIAVIGFVGFGAAQMASSLDKQATKGRTLSNVDAATQTLASLMNSASVCRNGVGGAPGLQFVTSTGATNSDAGSVVETGAGAASNISTTPNSSISATNKNNNYNHDIDGNPGAIKAGTSSIVTEPKDDDSDSTAAGGGGDSSTAATASIVSSTSGVFNLGQAQTKDGQNISISTSYMGADGQPIVLRTGAVINALGLKVDRLVLSNPVFDPKQPANTYTADVYGRFSSIDPNVAISTSDRVLTSLSFQIDPDSKQLVSCFGGTTAPNLCTGAGCIYNPSAAGQKCVCPFPDMKCPDGQYLADVSTDGKTPVCKPFSMDCSSKGPDYYMNGVDDNGAPICLQMKKAPCIYKTIQIAQADLMNSEIVMSQPIWSTRGAGDGRPWVRLPIDPEVAKNITKLRWKVDGYTVWYSTAFKTAAGIKSILDLNPGCNKTRPVGGYVSNWMNLGSAQQITEVLIWARAGGGDTKLTIEGEQVSNCASLIPSDNPPGGNQVCHDGNAGPGGNWGYTGGF